MGLAVRRLLAAVTRTVTATVATANPEVPYFTALRWQPAVGQETVHTGCMEAACFSPAATGRVGADQCGH